ncbi:alpha/beta fold hydrolase [Limisalsivibrio acetivorans]|uniref:alpha/beta fold hydrolase n=1 Tax=Limisalsivibrio acetivorans TaxID=1304888 RepID=UPI0003B69C30|nr:alpha/beta hydrolase [Limisalsivibrio acetivorans]
MPVLINGFAGSRELFPELKEWEIIEPYDEKAVLKRIEAGGDLLAGWSTGAHIILKYIDKAVQKFDRVILFAPFASFCEHTPERVVKLMIRGLRKDRDKVLADFLDKCSAPRILPDTYTETLAGSLEYLIRSRAESVGRYPSVKVVSGRGDKVVPISGVREAAESIGAEFIEMDCGHFFGGSVIEGYAR